jgi:hypothetical protein
MKNIIALCVALASSERLWDGVRSAFHPARAPEPDLLALIVIGGATIALVKWAKRNEK